MSELIDRAAADPTMPVPTGPMGGAGPRTSAAAAPGAADDPAALIAKENGALGEIQGRWDTERAPAQAQASALTDKLTSQADKPIAAAPLPVNSARHMNPQDMTQAASIFMTLGALAGFLTKRPMTAALNNMTAGLKGLQDGDAEQYDQAQKDFKVNFDTAIATNKAMLAEKEAALTDTKMSLAARMDQVRLIDAKYGNEVARATRTFDQQWKMIDANRKALAQAEQAAARLDQASQRLSMERERLGIARERTALAATTAAGPPGGISPQTVDYYARQSLAGDNSWQVGLARGKVGQALIAAVKDRIPQLAAENSIEPEEAAANKGQRDALNATLKDRQKFVAAANQFVGNFKKQADLVEHYMESGVAGEIPVLNRWIQAGRAKVAGDPDVTAFDNAIRGLAREHQRIVTGVTSNAQLHIASAATADELLNRDMAPDQIRAALAEMRVEAQNALDAGKAETDLITEQLKHMGIPRAPAAGAPTAPKPAAGAEQTATNPQTGEKLVLRNGQWVPAK